MEDLEYEGVKGTGAFAVVKRYRSRQDGAPVAVKMLTAEGADAHHRFRREIELVRALQPHPHIIELLGVHEDPVHPSYFMPMAESNLAAHIAHRNAELSEGSRVALFRQVCTAVAYAHERGVLHRDLAPPNVLLFPPSDAPVVRVADFGLGRALSSTSSRGGSIGQEVGHVAYVAPEQRLDLSAASTRSDVYALGRLLRFILTGRDPDALGACSFTHVVTTATTHDPARRYPDATRLLNAFEEMHALVAGPGAAFDLADLNDKSPMVDWRILHEEITTTQPVGHVYYTYLAPLTSYFSAGGRLASYQRDAGALFEAFVRRYVERMEDCMALTGWPFSAMSGFGRLLFHAYEVAESSDGRKAALEGLWLLAYEHDQWSVQDLVKTILRRGPLKPELDEAIAARIMTSGVRVDDGDFAGCALSERMRAALLRQRRN